MRRSPATDPSARRAEGAQGGGRPRAKGRELHTLIVCWLVFLHTLHCSLSTIFFVVLAFLWNTGLVCPPKPACFMS